MAERSSNKRIAKNTLLLYFRMLFMMLVSLYTSRVVLQQLGVSDYGIYEVVGGVVGLLSFLNGALASGSTRFLAYELGSGDMERMKKNFTSILFIHIVLAVLIALLLETVGIWLLHGKLTIHADRLDAATFTFHISVLTCIINITQVPYTASVMSHEKMGVYAYISIIEAVLKLAIVFLLPVGGFDKLKFYALLLFIVQTSIAMTYRIYCVCKFAETKFRFDIDWSIIKNILSYSFWNLFTNITQALKNQGSVVLISAFFSPQVVAARALATKINLAADQFANNFRTASNPQIIKRYAAGDINGSKDLTFATAKFSFFLMLMLGLPIILVAEPLIKLWLGQVPEYSAVFLQFAIASSLVNSMNNTFYTSLCAVGNLKWNSTWSAIASVITIPVSYVLFKLGFSPVAIAVVILVDDIIISLCVKPMALIRDADYKWNEIMSVFKTCFKVAVLASLFPVSLSLYKDYIFTNNFIGQLVLVIVSVISVCLCSWIWGIDKELKTKIVNILKNKINKYGFK